MTSDVDWCINYAAQLTLKSFATEFKYKNKEDANLRYSQILSSSKFEGCSHRQELLQQFQLWKNSTEEVAFWGEKAGELDEIKTEKAVGRYVCSSLRSSLRRRRPLKDLSEKSPKRVKFELRCAETSTIETAPMKNLRPAHVSFKDDLMYSSLQPATSYIQATSKNFWDEWCNFMQASESNKKVHRYSTGKRGVIICRDKILPEKKMPVEAYSHTITTYASKNLTFREIFEKELDATSAVLDTDPSHMLLKARQLASASDIREAHIMFLSDIFVHVIREIFVAEVDLSHSETAFNVAAVWPAIKFALHAMEKNNRSLKFFPGDDRLRSMSVQLEANRLGDILSACYKADAILRCPKKHKEIEILLLETSNAFDTANRPEISFDFHKGVYGSVSMLKTIADLYRYADFQIMAKLRVYFVHAHTKHIRLWSISCASKGVLIVHREDKCEIPTSFTDDQKYLLDYARFSWSLKDRLDKTMEVLDLLADSNGKNMKAYRYKDLPDHKDLKVIFEPSIVKLA